MSFDSNSFTLQLLSADGTSFPAGIPVALIAGDDRKNPEARGSTDANGYVTFAMDPATITQPRLLFDRSAIPAEPPAPDRVKPPAPSAGQTVTIANPADGGWQYQADAGTSLQYGIFWNEGNTVAYAFSFVTISGESALSGWASTTLTTYALPTLTVPRDTSGVALGRIVYRQFTIDGQPQPLETVTQIADNTTTSIVDTLQ
ncbi:hypothetical protein [Paucibacter sp. DJ2R-2]|uniref:hypothetical protein n=1 Tax=Paucibacter sp. DJ2R-2 TaxID=2893558 RepID=UPI0021E4CB90|nr:hypothetical protein [Paucibacter sp. DJ2R-2]MCV2420989.1 hypothetical protein [Paucibacter sp. DJ4R-1]MCV2438967.1 hypothetical protein [Paucibacter sp. DJ2R-2]